MGAWDVGALRTVTVDRLRYGQSRAVRGVVRVRALGVANVKFGLTIRSIHTRYLDHHQDDTDHGHERNPAILFADLDVMETV